MSNSTPPDIPRDVREGYVWSAIERMKRERSYFSCFGMSCATTVLALLATLIVYYYFLRR